jgi:hypothetical protein
LGSVAVVVVVVVAVVGTILDRKTKPYRQLPIGKATHQAMTGAVWLAR